MKRNVSKQTLSFMTSAIYKFIRTPKDIWADLIKEFDFTIDVCASDNNALLPRYYTEKENGLKQDWTGETVYCHPMFDTHIGKWVEKAFNSKCTTVMLLPAGTHTRYFHRYIYKNPNCEIRFLEKPTRGFNFGHEDGTFEEIPKGKVGYIKPLMIVVFRNKDVN